MTIEVSTDFSDAVFSPDGSRILANGSRLYAWETATGTLVDERDLPGVGNLAFSADGRLAARTTRRDPAGVDLYIVDLATGAAITKFAHDVDCYLAVFDPTGERLITSGADGKLRVWRTANGELLGTVVANVNADAQSNVNYTTPIALSADGNSIFAGKWSLGCWDTRTLEPRWRAARGGEGIVSIVTLEFSVYSAHYDGSVKEFAYDGRDQQYGRPIWGEGASSFWSLDEFAVSRDEVLAGSMTDVGITLLASGGDEPHVLYRGPRLTHQLAFSPDGTLLLGQDDERIRLWSVDTRTWDPRACTRATSRGSPFEPMACVSRRCLQMACCVSGTLSRGRRCAFTTSESWWDRTARLPSSIAAQISCAPGRKPCGSKPGTKSGWRANTHSPLSRMAGSSRIKTRPTTPSKTPKVTWTSSCRSTERALTSECSGRYPR